MKKTLLSILTMLCCLSFSVTSFGCNFSNLQSNKGSNTASDTSSDTEAYKPESLDNAISLGKLDFSAWNGEGADSDDREIKSDKLLGDIKSVYLSSDVNYENNLYKDEKIAIENFENSVKIVDVVICTDHETDNVYLATLNVYTRLITSTKDLRMFDQGITVSGLRKITGCYALTRDLMDLSQIYNQTSINVLNYYAVNPHDAYTYEKLGLTLDEDGNCLNESGEIVQYANADTMFGFAGSFDGRGHSLTFSCGSGLFNQLLYGAEIKNVAFKDINVLSGPSTTSRQADSSRRGPIGYSWQKGESVKEPQIRISDVFISLDERSFYEENVANKGLVLLPTSQNGEISFNNIIMDIDYDKAKLLEELETTDMIIKFYALSRNQLRVLNYPRYTTATKFEPFTNVLTIVRNQSYDNSAYLTSFCTATNVLTYQPYLQGSYYEEKLPVFESEEDMISKLSEDQLNAFDNGFWDISSGYPVWKN